MRQPTPYQPDNEAAPQKRVLFWQAIQQYLGLYTFTAEESAAFNSTIKPYFNRLRSDFYQLCEERGKYPCKDEVVDTLKSVIEQIEKDVSKCTRSDLYTIETYLFSIATDEYIEQAYPSLQDRYKSLAGSAAYDRYKNSRAKDIDTDKAKKRADSQFLISEARRLSIAIPRREAIRTWLILNVLLVSVVPAVLIALVITVKSNVFPWHHFPYLLVVSLMSLFGGLISVLRRIQSTPDEELNLAQWGRVSLVLSPITSMGFGIVLYYVLAGHLIQSPILPDPTKIESACPFCCVFAQCKDARTAGAPIGAGAKPSPEASPKCSSGIDGDGPGCIGKSPLYLATYGGGIIDWIKTFDFPQFATLLVWAFLAGFAEQFVPDTLDALIKRQTASPGKTVDVKASGN